MMFIINTSTDVAINRTMMMLMMMIIMIMIMIMIMNHDHESWIMNHHHESWGIMRTVTMIFIIMSMTTIIIHDDYNYSKGLEWGCAGCATLVDCVFQERVPQSEVPTWRLGPHKMMLEMARTKIMRNQEPGTNSENSHVLWN